MTTDALIRPFRSVLYLPGSKEKVLEKAKGLDCDALIFDLEDAVAPDAKPAARQSVADFVKAGGYGHRYVMVRVNGDETEWGKEDCAAMIAAEPDAILLPKVENATQIQEVAREIGDRDIAIWIMIETPRAILNIAEIADADPKLKGFVLGTNDLIKDLGAAFTADRAPIQTSLQMALLAARAAKLICVDGVYNAFKDEAGLKAECDQGRDLGMDGKTLIHPAQIDIANTAFAPSDAAVKLAEKQIAAYDEAVANGEGVAVVEGKIVENLHIVTARKTLAMADAINGRQG